MRKESTHGEPARKLYARRPDGYPALRVWHRKGTGKKSPRLLVKCGDCENTMEIHFDDEALEIGGVHGSLENWRAILLPLLKSVPARGSGKKLS